MRSWIAARAWREFIAPAFRSSTVPSETATVMVTRDPCTARPARRTGVEGCSSRNAARALAAMVAACPHGARAMPTSKVLRRPASARRWGARRCRHPIPWGRRCRSWWSPGCSSLHSGMTGSCGQKVPAPGFSSVVISVLYLLSGLVGPARSSRTPQAVRRCIILTGQGLNRKTPVDKSCGYVTSAKSVGAADACATAPRNQLRVGVDGSLATRRCLW